MVWNQKWDWESYIYYLSVYFLFWQSKGHFAISPLSADSLFHRPFERTKRLFTGTSTFLPHTLSRKQYLFRVALIVAGFPH